MKTGLTLAFLLAVAAGLGTWLALDHHAWGRVEKMFRQLPVGAHAEEPRPSKEWVSELAKKTTWDHLISLTPEQIKAIGVQTVTVKKRTDPTLLRLNGTPD